MLVAVTVSISDMNAMEIETMSNGVPTGCRAEFQRNEHRRNPADRISDTG